MSIRDNIAWSNVGATQSEIEAAARSANAHEFIMDTAHGYDTIVGDRGVLLSGGQRQRLGLARALLGERTLIVLDEATSALDSDSEEEILKAIRALRGRMTVIMIAHRLSTVRDCDVIFVLEKGHVVEFGSWSDWSPAPGALTSSGNSRARCRERRGRLPSMIDVLYVMGGLGIGGTERHLSLVLPELARRGWRLEVALLVSDGPFGEPLRAAGIATTRIENPSLISIPKLRGLQSLMGQSHALSQRLRAAPPRMMHCYLPTSCIVGGWAAHQAGFRPVAMSRRSQASRPPLFLATSGWSAARCARLILCLATPAG